jgi:hypothetical protein
MTSADGPAMPTFETTATVEREGQVLVSGVPFRPGTEVEVTISPKRHSAEGFAAAWQQLCANLRRKVPEISDDDIGHGVERHRAGA